MFLKYAKKYNCKVHCLGMTRKKVLNTVPFDFVDSSTWKQDASRGRFGKDGQVKREFQQQKGNSNYPEIFSYAYLKAMKMQEHYEEKWRHYSR